MGKSKRVALAAAAVLVALLLAELLFRAYYVVGYAASFTQPSLMFAGQYVHGPAHEDRAIMPELLSATNEYKIALLGASVLADRFGMVRAMLREELRTGGMDDVSIVNLSFRGHSSRDARLKQRMLANIGLDIDLFVVYHGINEVRANNCPPGLFRRDYSHYQWYELLNIAERHAGVMDITVIPYTVDLLRCRLSQRLRPRRYVPEHVPSDEWIKYGADVKTGPALESNLSTIIERARETGSDVLLMTFAFFVPPDYTFDRYKAGELSYGPRCTDSPPCPIEVWGLPDNVVAALEQHNTVIRSLAERHPEVMFIDMQAHIPATGEYFSDICHLTRRGNEAFAGRLAAAIRERRSGAAVSGRDAVRNGE